eukprot:g5262.t1
MIKYFYPYGNFAHEVEELRKYLDEFGLDGCSYILGNGIRGLQWHVFYATTNHSTTHQQKSISSYSIWEDKTVEICITGIDPVLARQFVQTEDFVDARSTTMKSGIAELMPDCIIDDYVFEPCGYSMNGFSELSSRGGGGGGILTTHITPEEQSSYASIEFCCLKESSIKSSSKVFNLTDSVQKILQIFNPQTLHIAVHSLQNEQEALCKVLPGYTADGLSIQYMNDGSQIAFKAFRVCTDSPVFSCPSLQSDYDGSISDFYPMVKSPSSASSDGYSPSPLSPFLGKKYDVKSVENPDFFNFTKSLILAENLQDTFYIMNLSTVHKLYQCWSQLFPRVEPFYAVKCNPDVVLLALLASLGVGFDCASKDEIKLVSELGISPSKIIFANACKHPFHMTFANDMGVYLTTFDTEIELQKLKNYYPICNALIRIRADDPEARCHLGNKYGAELQSVSALLHTAKQLGIKVIGVSFHVGSGATNPEAYTIAISLARKAFDLGLSEGFDMKILDIGGGFCSGKLTQDGLTEFRPVQEAVNAALDHHFPLNCGIQVIAEPGRFFAESCSTLLCQIFGKRDRLSGTGVPMIDYWITDGLYGSFNCIPYDHAIPRAIPMVLSAKLQSLISDSYYQSTIFGPTCDGLDMVMVDYPLPEMTVGDWLMFPNMGAYTLAGASNFNGIKASDVKVFYIWADFDQF